MGRMFQVLAQPTRRPEESAFRLQTVPPQEDTENGNDESVPFIEIGHANGVARPISDSRTLPKLASTTEESRGETYLTVAYRPLPEAIIRTPRAASPTADLATYHAPAHPASLAFRELRTAMTQQCPNQPPHSMLFTAALPQAGTTTVLLNLAITLARDEGSKVLVIDAHPSRPAIHDRLGLGTMPGWRDLLAQTTPIAWTLHRTPIENLYALPCGDQRIPPPDIDGEILEALFDRLKRRFEWILIDVGPWGHRHILHDLTALTEATYLVVRQFDIDEPQIAEVQEEILARSDRLRGFVLTSI